MHVLDLKSTTESRNWKIDSGSKGIHDFQLTNKAIGKEFI